MLFVVFIYIKEGFLRRGFSKSIPEQGIRRQPKGDRQAAVRMRLKAAIMAGALRRASEPMQSSANGQTCGSNVKS